MMRESWHGCSIKREMDSEDQKPYRPSFYLDGPFPFQVSTAASWVVGCSGCRGRWVTSCWSPDQVLNLDVREHFSLSTKKPAQPPATAVKL